MPKSHNKKRNIGIIYELLLRHISSSLVSNDKNLAEKALRIIESRFDKNTEIYKEFRLFNALARSTASSTSVVAAILSEAKSAARRCNEKTLNREKSLLIKDINYNLEDQNFYHRRIPEYKIYATIQTLLNDWRREDQADLTRVIEYEGKVAEWLLKEKTTKQDVEVNSDIDALVVKIMTEKLNKKYGGKLSLEQASLMNTYALRLDDQNEDRLRESLNEVRDKTIDALGSFKDACENDVLLEKFDNVLDKINKINLEEKIDDDTIFKLLTICELKNQLKEALNE